MASDKVDKSVHEARAKINNHFDKYQGEKYGEGWQKLWEKGDFLPWDRGAPNPALIDTLKQRHDLLGNAELDLDGKPRRKRALVPGCGRGVDVLLFKAFGYDAVGLEYSRDAVKACHVYEEEHGQDTYYETQDKRLGQGTAKFVVGDFFTDDWLDQAGCQDFDLIYDYTFFCAMDPSLRPRWARQMKKLLSSSPDGNLICLEFPTYKPLSAGGPPFGSPSEIYQELLGRPGEAVPDGSGSVPAETAAGSRSGSLERIAHFHPERTHEIGKDENGEVRDFVSIWRHST